MTDYANSNTNNDANITIKCPHCQADHTKLVADIEIIVPCSLTEDGIFFMKPYWDGNCLKEVLHEQFGDVSLHCYECGAQIPATYDDDGKIIVLMTDEELLDYVHITYDASFDLYKDGDIEEWERQSGKAVFYCTVFDDIESDNEIDNFIIHANDLKNFPYGDYREEAKQVASEMMRKFEDLLKRK